MAPSSPVFDFNMVNARRDETAKATPVPVWGATGAVAERAIITQRISELERELAYSKQSYNATMTPCSLPTEILCAIFLHRASDQAQAGEGRRDVRWISEVSHVCHRWRVVAMDCSPLWSDLSFLPPPLLDLALGRSGTRPLIVTTHNLEADPQLKAGKDKTACHHPLQSALGQTQRLRSIHLTSTSKHALRSFLFAWHKDAPLLEDLRLGSSAYLVGSEDAGHSAAPDLRLHAPTLKSLDLSNCSFPWKKIPFSPCLTVLRLSDHELCSRRPHMREFMESLRRMPLLEVLDLRGVIPAHGNHVLRSPKRQSFSRVKLPSLRELYVEDLVGHLVDVLQVFVVPRKAKVEVVVKNSIPLPSIATSVGNIISALDGLTGLKRTPVQYVRISLGSHRTGKSTKVTVAHIDPFADSSSTTLSLHPRIADEVGLPQLFGLFRQSMQLSSLQTLHLQGVMVSGDDWTALFHHLRSISTISTLHMSDCCLLGFLAALGGALYSHFPGLKEVVLTKIWSHMKNATSEQCSSAHTALALAHVLKRRSSEQGQGAKTVLRIDSKTLEWLRKSEAEKELAEVYTLDSSLDS